VLEQVRRSKNSQAIDVLQLDGVGSVNRSQSGEA
jgi:hypothetical protein